MTTSTAILQTISFISTPTWSINHRNSKPKNGFKTVYFSRFRTRDLKVYRDLLCKLQIQGGQKEKGHLERLLRNRVYDKSWKKRAILQCYNWICKVYCTTWCNPEILQTIKKNAHKILFSTNFGVLCSRHFCILFIQCTLGLSFWKS